MGETETTIRAAHEIDADWLTEALHADGVGVGRRIASVASTSIGTGQVGESVRFDLEWQGDSDGPVPTSVVGKFPSASAVSRATAVQVGNYLNEVGFYRDVQAMVDITTPRMHHIGWDPDTHDFVLLMEDLCDAVQGDQLGGCDVSIARAAIREAAALHAPTWGRVDDLRAVDWLTPPGEERTAMLAMMFTATLPGFIDRYRDTLDVDVIDLAERVVEAFPQIARATSEWAGTAGAWCVVHNDFRLDNVLVGAAPGTPDVTVVDWQTVSFGAGPTDVAYFLGSGLVPTLRASSERELVSEYAASLRDRGVDIGDDLVWECYVLGSAGGLLMSVLASQIVERTERGDAMFVVMAERHAAQIDHVGLLDRI